MCTVRRKTPVSNGDPSGPVIWARICVMSAGLGKYAAMPGGGSLVRRDISRMRRALVAGFIVEGRYYGLHCGNKK